jgi:soluble lytic murein transglycosylase
MAWGVAACGVSGCNPRAAGGGTAEVSANPVHPTVILGATEETSILPKPLGDWAQAVSLERWKLASEAFDHQYPWPPPPELRYVRARIAFELDEFGRAVELLRDLELSGFENDVADLRAESQLSRQPQHPPRPEDYLSAAETFRKRGAGRASFAAKAFVSAGQPKAALLVLAEALENTPKDQSATVASLLAQQAQIFESVGEKQKAIKNHRRLALELATTEAASGSDQALERLTQSALSKKERYARAEAFTEKGDLAKATRELELMNKAPGAAPPGVDVLRTMAWAQFKSRGDYEKASKLFTQAAALDPTHRTQDLFFAARALSRANQDELAIERYLELAKKSPESSYAEQARYFAARLYFLLGRSREAVLAYSDYQRRYKAGRFIDAVRWERGLARLALGEGKEALLDIDHALAKTTDAKEQAYLRELRGVALDFADRTDEAAQEWARVIDESPLSLAAMLSAARLQALGREPPPAITGPLVQEGAPLVVQLPSKVSKLFEWGLHDAAARELYAGRGAFVDRHAPTGERALCQAFGLFSTAELRFGYAHRVVPERVLMRGIETDTRWQWDCIYPRPYESIVAEEQARHGVPDGLVFAVMRQESAFKPRVRSPVGATGLMQLMPATAERAASEIGVAHDPDALVSPPYNIALGTFYLGKLLRSFDGNVPLTAAAYNAGPNAVRRWLKGSEGLPLDVWLARIPYDETRDYVRRVVGNWARYRYVQSGLDALPEIVLELPEVVPSETVEY